MDLSQFAVDGLVAVAVFIIVNLVVKPIIEVWITQTNVAHDPLIRGLAVFLGIVGVFVDHGFPPPAASGSVWIGLVLSGILSGLSAIGLFHVAGTGSTVPTVTQSVVTGPMPTGPANSALIPAPPVQQVQPAPTQHVVTLQLANAPTARLIDVATNLPPAVAPQSSSPEPAAPAASPA